jgi:hypothetical protein
VPSARDRFEMKAAWLVPQVRGELCSGELGLTTGLVNSQKLLLSEVWLRQDVRCGGGDVVGAEARSAFSSLLLLLRGAALHRLSACCQAAAGAAAQQVAPVPPRTSKGALAASPLRSNRAVAALRCELCSSRS